ncbi:methylmalonyl-CoA mutase family protein [Candidatus Marinimicrobia bacterium]|nr:methylmalonyl-CoA mutase family protein [Candidatus Neomarinimicrobiota bacterium]MDC3333822.1 methylmalonyl-CoA mutase family protein [Candidatus Neomarinimicrobiota bacterium]
MKKEKPGKFPFTRGLYPEMYSSRLWTMRQYAGFTSAKESNSRYKYLLENGVMGLSVAFDLPTQIGYDSDDSMAEGEVGRVGVPISTLENMHTLFDGIPLDSVSTSMTINSTAAILLSFYIVNAENKGIPLTKLKGTIQNDILKEFAARGTYIYPPYPSMRIVTNILEFCNQNLPKWNPISISGYHIREAGSTVEQELAFTFANGIAYMETAIKNGLDLNQLGQQISFFFNSHNGFLEEIAKFRAARKIWSTIMKERFGVTNKKAMMCRFHTQTGGSTLTSEQPDNNIVRTTIQALSAVLGGTQSLHTNSFDEALSLPSDESAKLALRTQQIIAHESNIVNHPDPFGGSYIIEEMTEELVKKSFKIISEIDSLGGAIKAIESGWIENQIAKSAYDYQKDVDHNKKIVVGVNQFRDENQKDIDTFNINLNSANDQINSLIKFKENRDNSSVNEKLERLKTLAQSTDNIMPGIIDCVKGQCTLGEISNVMRDIFGIHE